MHAIRAVIGTPPALEAIRAALPSARVVHLAQGLALLPAVPAVIAEAGAGEKVGGFYGLTGGLDRTPGALAVGLGNTRSLVHVRAIAGTAGLHEWRMNSD